MTTELVTVNPSTPLAEAKELLRHNNFHHLPVVDHNFRLRGILSQSDFIKAHDATQGMVSDLMTSGMAKLDTEDTVRTAANVFAFNRFHALPVVGEDDKLLGMITTLDLIQMLDRETVELSDYNT